MIAVNKLKAQMMLYGVTQEKLAKIVGITPKTMSLKIKKGVFSSIEIEKMIDALKIENPIEIFFAK